MSTFDVLSSYVCNGIEEFLDLCEDRTLEWSKLDHCDYYIVEIKGVKYVVTVEEVVKYD